MVRCVIWYHCYKVKNVKNINLGVLILIKLQLKVALLHGCWSCFLDCADGTKSLFILDFTDIPLYFNALQYLHQQRQNTYKHSLGKICQNTGFLWALFSQNLLFCPYTGKYGYGCCRCYQQMFNLVNEVRTKIMIRQFLASQNTI